MKNEIECYGLHIPQKYFKKMFSKKVMDLVNRHDGVMVAMSKDPMLYVASFVFPTKKTT